MEAHRLGLPLAVGIAVVAAGAATFVLQPRNGLIEPAPVAAEAYFSPSQLDRAHDYTNVQRLLGLGGLAIEGVTLGVLALRPPRRLRRLLERGAARPILASAAAGAGFSVLLVVVQLPLSVIAEQRSRDFGLSTRSWGLWLEDLAKSTGISIVFTAIGAMLLMGVIRRFPRAWFAVGAVGVVALSALFVYVTPVLLDPLFNKFEPLPAGKQRSGVLALAEKAGVDVGQVYRVDASRRTTGANAYVNGIGHTKRVVIYDNLLRDFTPEEVNSVVAHELGHVKHRDVPRGLLWLAIVAPAGMLLVQRLTVRIEPSAAAGRRAGPVALPAAAASIALVSFVLGIAGNAMSRKIERSADGYSLALYGHPDAFIGVEKKLAIQNIADPNPPGWLQVLFGTHPRAVDRIGYALTWQRDHPGE
jgi:STE24 endopeptidase